MLTMINIMKTYSLHFSGKRLSFIKAGAGPCIFLFHASPLSSKSLIPFIQKLAVKYTVIAIDTPGYGNSELPDEAPESIKFYADRFHDLQKFLHINKLSIYGTATGAQIAIRYALEYPQSVDHVYLDNAAHFTDEETTEIMKHYFPDLSVKDDGSHLQQTWNTVNALFEYFPWCFREEANKIHKPKPPLNILNHIMLYYLRAGAEYDWAYRVAFLHERKSHVLNLKVPCTLFKWEGSILGKYMGRLFEAELQPNIKKVFISIDDDRFELMSDCIFECNHATNVSLEWSESIVEWHQQKHDSFNQEFPPSKEDGAHWMEAWEELNVMDSTIEIMRKNEILINWATKNI